MSKRKEKILKKQAEREAKREEEIKNGIVRRVTYEEKEKKPSLPNRLCPFVTPEEEMEDRQETVEKAVMLYHRMLSNLLPKLASIKDPRNPLKIKHKMSVLLIYGILMSMYMIGLLKDLIRSKKFKNYLHNKHFLIAIDGTQKFSRNYQWAPECLERHVGGEEKAVQYYCYVLEAVIILDNGVVLPVMSEFIENGKYEKDESKQDCERKGFYRMSEKLKKIFHNTKLSIVADGLYACGPVITMCKKWIYMPFKKVNVKEEINKRLENDIELKKAYDCAQREYEVLKQLVKMRNEIGLSQSDVARKSGLTQQMVSRIETEMMAVLRILFDILGLEFPEDAELLASHKEARQYFLFSFLLDIEECMQESRADL